MPRVHGRSAVRSPCRAGYFAPVRADAARAARAQRVASYAMGVLLVALATAVVLRTGALQLFSSALRSAITGAGAGGATAAAAVVLTPGLGATLARCRQPTGAPQPTGWISRDAERELPERCVASRRRAGGAPRAGCGLTHC